MRVAELDAEVRRAAVDQERLRRSLLGVVLRRRFGRHGIDLLQRVVVDPLLVARCEHHLDDVGAPRALDRVREDLPRFRRRTGIRLPVLRNLAGRTWPARLGFRYEGITKRGKSKCIDRLHFLQSIRLDPRRKETVVGEFLGWRSRAAGVEDAARDRLVYAAAQVSKELPNGSGRVKQRFSERDQFLDQPAQIEPGCHHLRNDAHRRFPEVVHHAPEILIPDRDVGIDQVVEPRRQCADILLGEGAVLVCVGAVHDPYVIFDIGKAVEQVLRALQFGAFDRKRIGVHLVHLVQDRYEIAEVECLRLAVPCAQPKQQNDAGNEGAEHLAGLHDVPLEINAAPGSCPAARSAV